MKSKTATARNSRWVRGNERYPQAILSAIEARYAEQPGWYRGARVTVARVGTRRAAVILKFPVAVIAATAPERLAA